MAPAELTFDEETDLSPESPAHAQTSTRPRTRIRWSDADGTFDRDVSGRIVVGSAAGADVCIRDPTVSRLHAEIDCRDDGVWVRDLGSRNGTFVEGILMTAARLPAASTVRVGSTALRVESTADAETVEYWPVDRFGPLVGRTAVMREMFAQLDRVAKSEATVLLHGETGTGKELVARAIHDASPRSGGPFIVVDCGALAESMLEAELFGHARGSFTGAVTARAGALESAEGGTAFLDEIGELPLAMQPRLLRAIESRTIRRLGESTYRTVDVRFVTATHRDLRRMVNDGAFREDLYFRLAVIPVTVPPLRARLDDIPLLVDCFLPPAHKRPVDPVLLTELVSRPWLGNVRELRNVVERVLALGVRQALRLDETAAAGGVRAPTPSPMTPPSTPSFAPPPPVPVGIQPAWNFSADEPFKDVRDRLVDALERQYIAALLDRHRRNISAVATAAGLNRGYIYRLIRKHGL